MDKLKITISGIEEITVKGISIGDVKKRKVNSKFNYDANNNYVGEIEHEIIDGTNYDLFIDVTGREKPIREDCTCNIINETKTLNYGTQNEALSINGGVNFVFDIY